jgi:hypothetical protein
MALDSFAHLQTAVADWLNRSDLTAVIPDFVTLAEVEMKRRLRRTSVSDQLDIDDEVVDLPSDLSELRSISLVTGSPNLDTPLRLCTPEMLAERKARGDGVSGRPTDFAIVAGQLQVAPAPDQTYTANIVYFQTLDPLSTTNTSNTVLDEAPDAYLFGALLQAEPYLEHDDRIPVWRERFDRAIDQLNDKRAREEDDASLRSVRLPIVFG